MNFVRKSLDLSCILGFDEIHIIYVEMDGFLMQMQNHMMYFLYNLICMIEIDGLIVILQILCKFHGIEMFHELVRILE